MIKQDAKDWINTLNCVLGAAIPQQLAQDVVKVQQGIRALQLPAKDTAESRLNCLEGQMHRIARAEVERLARQVLRNGLKGRNRAREFVMAMGSAFFVDRNGEVIDNYTSDGLRSAAFCKPLNEFLEQWDSMLHLTGAPMRIDHPDEPVRTDW